MNRGTYSYAVCPSGFTELCSCVRRSGASLVLPPAAAARCAGWAEGLSSSVCPLLQLLLGTITFISVSPLSTEVGQHLPGCRHQTSASGLHGEGGGSGRAPPGCQHPQPALLLVPLCRHWHRSVQGMQQCHSSAAPPTWLCKVLLPGRLPVLLPESHWE